MNFDTLLLRLTDIHSICEYEGAKAVNKAMTLRNWLFGAHLVEYEQHGEDRAVYGDRLLERVAENFSSRSDIPMSATTLRVCRQFYHTYPAIYQTMSDIFTKPMLGEIHQTLSDESEIALAPDTLVNNLSFSHFVELVKITDPLKRTFYEVESIRGTWSIRELKRQISTLYFERTGVSTDIKTLVSRLDRKTEHFTGRELLKTPYTFEFLGLPMEGAVEESRLEQALITNIESFLLELGMGFCFEARQKRILIGGEYYFVDLVFYHRILKCHVLIELKVDSFKHENAGQLNSYVAYYNKNVRTDSDNPAIGLLLCTGGNEELIEYATASMDENLFVRNYMVNLPDKEKLREIIRKTKVQFPEVGGNNE